VDCKHRVKVKVKVKVEAKGKSPCLKGVLSLCYTKKERKKERRGRGTTLIRVLDPRRPLFYLKDICFFFNNYPKDCETQLLFNTLSGILHLTN
jgi:hypothetical protein